jgi:hypothetical protein
MNAYIATDEPSPLSAKGMRDITRNQLASLMNLPLMRERPHETLPVVVGEADDVAVEIVELAREVLNSTGKILVDKKYDSLGAFVFDALQDAARLEPRRQADSLVEAASFLFDLFFLPRRSFIVNASQALSKYLVFFFRSFARSPLSKTDS